MNRAGKSKAALEVEDRQRETEAVRLRARGMSYADIAAQLGWADRSAARKAVARALDRSNEAEVATLRQLSLARLDEGLRHVWEVLEADHLTVQWGRVVVNPATQKPLLNLEPKLRAVDRLVKLEQQRARLLGLEAPLRRIVEVITPELVREAMSEADREYADLMGLSPADEQAIAEHLNGATS